MGRRAGKLKVEFVDNQKTRSLVFKRRKDSVKKMIKEDSVKKMIKELSTLCDVKAGMVLFDPGHDSPPADALWPPNNPAQVRGLIQEFMGDDEKRGFLGDEQQQEQVPQFGPNFDNSSSMSPFGVYLQKKIELARAKIDQLKSQRPKELMGGDADLEQDPQFGRTVDNSSSMYEKAPIGLARAQIDRLLSQTQRELMDDDEADHQPQHDQFGLIFDLDGDADQHDQHDQFGSNYQLVPANDQFHHHQDQFGLLDLDYESMYQEDSSCNHYHFPQQQQYQLGNEQQEEQDPQFGPTLNMDEAADDVDEQTQFVRARIDEQHQQQQDQFGHVMPLGPLMVDDSSYPQQLLQYPLFDSSSPSLYKEDDSSTVMMMTHGPNQGEEGASCSTQTTVGDVAVQHSYDDSDFIGQLYTPPRMTWQSTTDDDHLLFTQFEDNGPADYLQYINFDDFLV